MLSQSNRPLEVENIAEKSEHVIFERKESKLEVVEALSDRSSILPTGF